VTVSRELSRYILYLVGVQEDRWEGSGTASAGEYTFFYGSGSENDELGASSFYIKVSYQQLMALNLLVVGCHT
jgi:hypothetical protein